MKTKLKLGIALSVFSGLIILTGLFRSTPDNSGEIASEEIPDDFDTHEYYLSGRDTTTVLKTFFAEGEIISDNLIRWKPDVENKLKMNVSGDGFCYTTLDTIIFSEKKQGKAIYIFTTGFYVDDKLLNCQACAPDISIGVVDEMNFMHISAFSKNVVQLGELGKTGIFELIDSGEDKELIKLTCKIHSDDGIFREYIALVDTDNLKQLVKFESYCSNELSLDDPYGVNKGLVKKEVELSTEYGKEGKYDIVLNQKETNFDSVKEKIITRYTTRVYRWNNEEELELCYE